MALHPVMGLAVASMMAVAPARATVEPPGFGAVPAVRSFQLAPGEFESDILRGLEIDDPENSSALLFAPAPSKSIAFASSRPSGNFRSQSLLLAPSEEELEITEQPPNENDVPLASPIPGAFVLFLVGLSALLASLANATRCRTDVARPRFRNCESRIVV